MPNFQEFHRRARPTRSEPLVTIQRKGVFHLNQAAYEALGRPEAVILLFDPDENTIGFRPADLKDLNAYRARQMGEHASYVIAGKAFLDYFNIPLDSTRRYRAELLNGILAVDLRQEPSNVDRGAPSNDAITAAN